MSDLSNFLAFLGLVTTLLMVWRQSRPARVRLLAAQSLLLAAQAMTIAAFTARYGLLLVAAALVVVKVWWIPRALTRMGRGAPPRPRGPGRSAGIQLLLAGAAGEVVGGSGHRAADRLATVRFVHGWPPGY